jgi:hypothetical protein
MPQLTNNGTSVLKKRETEGVAVEGFEEKEVVVEAKSWSCGSGSLGRPVTIRQGSRSARIKCNALALFGSWGPSSARYWLCQPALVRLQRVSGALKPRRQDSCRCFRTGALLAFDPS